MGFNCNGLSIKLVKIAQDSEVRNLLATDSRVDNSWKVKWEAHTGIWIIFCQTIFCKSLHTWPTREWPTKLSAWMILSMTLIPFTHTIYISSLLTKLWGYSEENLGEVSTTPTLLERTIHPQERNSRSLFSSPLPLSYLERRFVPKHNPHLFKV